MKYSYIITCILFLYITSCDGYNQKRVTTSNRVKDTITRSLIDKNHFLTNTKNSCNYEFNSDSINICLLLNRSKQQTIKFSLSIRYADKVMNLSGIADLILLEDEKGNQYLPEGTFIIDENTNKNYECDSTYSYNSQSLSLGFGIEKITAHRLSLVIGKSNIPELQNMIYTLYKQK